MQLANKFYTASDALKKKYEESQKLKLIKIDTMNDFFKHHGIQGRASICCQDIHEEGTVYCTEENAEKIILAMSYSANKEKYGDQMLQAEDDRDLCRLKEDSPLLAELRKEYAEKNALLRFDTLSCWLREIIPRFKGSDHLVQFFLNDGKLFLNVLMLRRQAPSEPIPDLKEIRGSEFYSALEDYVSKGNEVEWYLTDGNDAKKYVCGK